LNQLLNANFILCNIIIITKREKLITITYYYIHLVTYQVSLFREIAKSSVKNVKSSSLNAQ